MDTTGVSIAEKCKRCLSRLEVARSIVKLSYSRDKPDIQPMLAEALMVPAREQSTVFRSGPTPQSLGTEQEGWGG